MMANSLDCSISFFDESPLNTVFRILSAEVNILWWHTT